MGNSKRDGFELKRRKYDNKNNDLLVYHLYGLTYDAPSTARLNTCEKKEICEEVLIVDPETPITREEYEKEQ